MDTEPITPTPTSSTYAKKIYNLLAIAVIVALVAIGFGLFQRSSSDSDCRARELGRQASGLGYSSPAGACR